MSPPAASAARTAWLARSVAAGGAAAASAETGVMSRTSAIRRAGRMRDLSNGWRKSIRLGPAFEPTEDPRVLPCGRRRPRRPAERFQHLLADAAARRRMGRRRIALDDRPPRVSALADRRVQGDLAEERDRKTRRLAPASSVSEDVGPVAAVRTVEEAHVLHDSEDRNSDLAEHRHALD